MEWAIDAAEKSHLIDDIYLTTNDNEIANIIRPLTTATYIGRPIDLATDDTPDHPVFKHALEWIAEASEDKDCVDVIVHLRPTCPLRDPRMIDRAILMLINYPIADCVKSVSVPSENPFKMWSESKQGRGRIVPFAEAHLTGSPRQLLPKVWWGNPYVDVIRARTITEKGSMVGDLAIPFVIPHRVIDIDEPMDLVLTEALLRERSRKKREDEDVKRRTKVVEEDDEDGDWDDDVNGAGDSEPQ